MARPNTKRKATDKGDIGMTGGDNISNIKEMYRRECKQKKAIKDAIDFLDKIDYIYCIPDQLRSELLIIRLMLTEVLDE